MTGSDAPTRRERPGGGDACPPDDELAAFVDGSLAEDRRPGVEAHVDGCAACRAVVGHVGATAAAPARRAIGRYRLDRELGRGGMGVVWKAWDPALERPVAVKLLHPELDDELWRARALREARALARLQHANVIAVYDVGEDAGEVFIVSELIDGESLDRWQRGRPAAAVLAAYAQAGRGLAAAHDLGLVHRDVKPSNILVARDGRVCVGDFGLATSARRPESLNRPPRPATTTTQRVRQPLPTLTAAGELVGTPAYMAPEQHAGAAVDARADQYALCLALAEALIGGPPPDLPTAEALAAAAPGVTAPWAAIARGLAREPGDRFADMRPLIAALEATGAPRPAPARWRWPVAALAGATALAGAVAWSVRARDSGRGSSARAAPGSADAGPAVAPNASSVPSAPSAPSAPNAWTWIASDTGPFRLPLPARRVRIADPRRAVVLLDSDALVVVALDDGAVSAPVRPFPADVRIGFLVRAGGRILAFTDRVDRAWQIELDPPGATELPMPAPRGRGRASRRLGELAVGPEGDVIVTCDATHRPVARDAATLAIRRELPATECGDLWFATARSVVIGAHQIDLATGRTSAPGPITFFAGPGGVQFAIAADPDAHTRTATVEGDRQSVFEYDPPFDYVPPIRWTPDGVAITWWRTTLGLRPAAGGARRTAMTGVERVLDIDNDFDVDDRRAVLVDAGAVEVFDLATGARTGADGNLGSIDAIAPSRGAVVTSADRLRVWRDGRTVGSEPQPVRRLLGAPDDLGVFRKDDDGGVAAWDPTTGVLRRIGPGEELLSTWMAITGDELLYAFEHTVRRSRRGEPGAPWRSVRADLALLAAEPDRWIAATDRDRLYVADIANRRALAWGIPTCVPEVTLIPGANRLLGTDRIPWVADLREGATQRELAVSGLPLRSPAIAVRPGGGLVVAQDSALVVIAPDLASGTLWRTGVRDDLVATEVGVSADGREVAIGYATGAVVWAHLAGVEAHGARVAVALRDPESPCLVEEAEPAEYDALSIAEAR